MRTHRYVFARTFVKLAILIAILTFLAGLAGGFIRLADMNIKIAEAAYHPTGDLIDSVASVGQNLAGTRERVLFSLSIDEFPDNLKISTFPPGEDILSGVAPEMIPDHCGQIADKASGEVQAIREFHASQFRTAIAQLRQALLDHATRVKAVHSTPATPSPAPPPTDTPIVDPQPTSLLRYRVFDGPIREDKERFEDIQTMQTLLSRLAENSEKAENRNAIARAQQYLDKAPALLDLETRQEPTPVQIPQPTTAESSPPELIAKAEIIASKLAEAEGILRNSLYTKWRIDADIERLRAQARENAALVIKLAEVRKNELRVGVREAGLSIVISLVAAFIVLVIADLVRAFLNLSNNTDTLADASLGQAKANSSHAG